MFNFNKDDFMNQVSEEMTKFLKDRLELIMREEIRNYLEVENPDIPNSRNGYYSRNLEIRHGRIEGLEVPRDRMGCFQTQLYEPYSRREGWLEEAIIQMYKSGMSTRDVGQFVEKIIGTQYSPTTITNVTNTVLEDIQTWQKRPLEVRYSVLFMDGLYIPLKRDTVENESIYVVMGINEDGYRQILGFYVGGAESSNTWKDVLQDLYNRGVREVLLGVSDGLPGLKQAFLSVFPKADYQRCVVHKMRNTTAKVRVKDKSEVVDDLKKIYEAPSYEEAIHQFGEYEKKWYKKYPREVQSWKDDLDDLLTFYKYPPMIRAFIYTTNILERTNKDIRKRLRPMNSIANVAAAEKIVYLFSINYNEQWGNRAARGFKDEGTKKELTTMFNKRYSV